MEYISDLERKFNTSQEPYGLAVYEAMQASTIGYDVSAVRARAEALSVRGEDDTELKRIYAELPKAPPPGWRFFEESELAAIEGVLPKALDRPLPVGPDLTSRMRGAWLGRVAGNMVGKPIEWDGAWNRSAIRSYLEDHGAYPLRNYVPITDSFYEIVERYFTSRGIVGVPVKDIIVTEGLSLGKIQGGVRDDDVDYTILNLVLLETSGIAYSREDVARLWLSRMPAYQTASAERAAYNNLIREVPLERVGEHHNPYREWIGALIRADVFGYVYPGSPRRAALLAYEDAALSHRGNGIFGEMWAAALVASAFTAASPEASVRESLNHIPARSRLAVEIAAVLDDHAAGGSWDEAMTASETRCAGMHYAHTINNAGALTVAILWGDGDFSATIGNAAQAGPDSDSIGATAGSWAGAFLGEEGIPEHWLTPLDGRTRSAVFGFGDISLTEMADRTLRLVERFAETTS